MRRALLALLLLAPLALASPASEPYTFRASLAEEPRVGRPVALTVVVEAAGALDAPLRLETPEWVEIDGPAEWRVRLPEGGRAEQTWSLTPTREGYWRASLAVDAARAEAWAVPVERDAAWQPVHGCCLYAWSTPARGLAGERPEDGVPGENVVGFHPSFRALDAELAEMTVRLSPQDKRFAGQELLFQMPLGSATLERAPADEPHEFRHAFPLRDGEGAVLSPAGYVRVRFDAGEHAGEEATYTKDVACANIQVERAGDDVRETGRWGCMAQAGPRGIPAAPATLALAAALLARKKRYPVGPA